MSIIEKAIEKLNQNNQKIVDTPDIDVDVSKIKNQKSSKKPEFSDLQLKFNVETLSAAGIVAPDEHAPYLSDEFRRIKRPLLNNAFGSSSELVERGNVIMVTSSLPGEGKSFSSVN